MSEPAVTTHYGWPRQLAGAAARERMNATIDAQDQTIAQLANLLASLHLLTPHIKIHDPIVALGGETLITLQEPYQHPFKRLLVFASGSLLMDGLHYTVPDANHIAFTDALYTGERVQVVEFQLGDDSGAPPGLPPGPLQEAIEETPSGSVNSTNGSDGNGIFTTQHPLADGTVPTITVAGLFDLTFGVQFTWVYETNQFEILAPHKPAAGETLRVTYQWRND